MFSSRGCGLLLPLIHSPAGGARPSVKTILKRGRLPLLRAYCERHAPDLALTTNWTADEPALRRSLCSAFDNAGPLLRARLQTDVDRVMALASEAGTAALKSVSLDWPALEALPSHAARALFVFLADPARFRRAEEIRFTDEHRRGRMWSGFIGPVGCDLHTQPDALERFKAALRCEFESQNVHVEVYTRARTATDGSSHDLVQVTICREGWPDEVLEFQDGELGTRSRRPVYEAAITYEPSTGSIEVVATEKTVREEIAERFCSELLDWTFTHERLPLRRYDLSVLKRPFVFESDPEDRIAEVRVTLVRLMPLDEPAERLTLEVLSGAGRTIWEMADERLGPGSPLTDGWIITQARLSIQFHPEPGGWRGKTLPLTITMPHSCDLKDRTERERLIGAKYLSRWNILQEI